MKVLLDIQDSKAAFIMELLKNFAYVKATKLTDSKAPILTKAQKEAIDQGLKDLEEGRVIPQQQVMEETKKRYYNLFK
jgi:hypothetical protein